MSIVALKKATLCGLIGEKAKVLEGLQALGRLHLVALRPPPREPEKAPPAHPEDAYKALRHLLDCPERRRPVKEDAAFDMAGVVARSLANQQRIRDLTDRRDFLAGRIRALEPWGEFRLPPLEALAGHRLWFYIVPHGKMREMRVGDLAWEVVHRDNRYAYVVAIARDEPPAAAMPVPRTRTGALPIGELERRLERVELELEDLAAEREALTRWIFLLVQHLAGAEDRAALRYACEQTRDEETLFAVQGWVPATEVERLSRFVEAHRLALLIEEPTAADRPPTLLRNPRELAGGEDLVRFFQTPGYRGWDPSLVLFFSFALFFAMILADAGYAAVLLLGLLLAWRRLRRSERGLRLRNLGTALVAASLGYGVLAGSYFGLAPPGGSWLAALKVIDINDYDGMMRLSVCIGVIHVAMANAFVAWQSWGRPAAFVPLGWIAALCGGLGLWLGGGEPGWLGAAGGLLLAGGLVTVFAFGGERPVRRPSDWLWRALGGLQALASVPRAFGDVLSYLRLFALGLASASLALTFNELARDAAASVPGAGLLLSLLILFLGHTLNLALSVVSGVVHGLRLNFIEFYNWGVSEEGYPFQAFAKKEVQS